MSDEAAIRAFPALGGLVALRESGWSFLHLNVIDDVPAQVDGYRAWQGGWIDAIRVRSDTDAMALRTDGNESPGIVWERSGTLAEVIEELLTLPAPDARLAPRLVRATGPILWTP
jgi:hypothetical protein